MAPESPAALRLPQPSTGCPTWLARKKEGICESPEVPGYVTYVSSLFLAPHTSPSS